MDQKSWYRRFFSRTRRFDLEATQAAAEQGNVEAQFALGVNCGIDQEALPDFVRAAQWYRKAAEQNHSLAQFNLGLMYAKGQGVPLDDIEAVSWIRKAAHQGDAGAQFNLGIRCHRACLWGRRADALESKIEAYKWLQLAAAQGYKGSAEAYERVTLDMTREEVAEGNQRAAAVVTGKTGGPGNPMILCVDRDDDVAMSPRQATSPTSPPRTH